MARTEADRRDARPRVGLRRGDGTPGRNAGPSRPGSPAARPRSAGPAASPTPASGRFRTVPAARRPIHPRPDPGERFRARTRCAASVPSCRRADSPLPAPCSLLPAPRSPSREPPEPRRVRRAAPSRNRRIDARRSHDVRGRRGEGSERLGGPSGPCPAGRAPWRFAAADGDLHLTGARRGGATWTARDAQPAPAPRLRLRARGDGEARAARPGGRHVAAKNRNFPPCIPPARSLHTATRRGGARSALHR